MKPALIIVVIVAAVAIGFWLVQDDGEPVPVTAPDPVTAPADDPAAEEPLEEMPEEPLPDEPAPDPVEEAPAEDDALLDDPATEPESVIDQALDEADAAAEEAESAIADILEQQEEAAAEAEEAARRAIEEAMSTGDEAAAEAEAAVSEAERAMREQLEATEPETESMLRADEPDPLVVEADEEGLFTPEGFEFDQAMEVIEESDLDPINMSAARALLESVRDDPDALDAALNQLRDMLGL